MMKFILNNEDIVTDLPSGVTVLDFVRYHKGLKGTKIGCREGDCGACTILVGELVGDTVRYRSMTSCLMPLANAAGKHIVTIEGINPADGSLTPVQQAMVDESGTQCGFCTVGFVMSLTGACLDGSAADHVSAVSSIDGNICRCTGYKSIERAARQLSRAEPPASAGGVAAAITRSVVPKYFENMCERLTSLASGGANGAARSDQPLTRSLPPVGGGTDLYVQRPDEMAEAESAPLLYNDKLRGIRDTGEHIEIGASATVTDLLESPVMNAAFPDLYKHLKLVSSTPIRNMATLAGNFVNASPIGDMTVWFLALDVEMDIHCPSPRMSEGDSDTSSVSPLLTRGRGQNGATLRTLPLHDLYLGYKQLAKQPGEIITTIRFKKPTADFRFNFEKVCKRTYLDIATVNTAISLTMSGSNIAEVHVAAGGVAPIPLYLKATSAFLRGREISAAAIIAADEIMQSEISPISDVRGTEQYKRLLLRQLFRAHFYDLFATEITENTEK